MGHDESGVERAIDRLGRIDSRTLERYFESGDNRIAPLLYSHLKRLHLSDRLPPSRLEYLHTQYLRNCCRNAILHSHLVRLAAEAHTRGIELLLLKGAATLVDGNEWSTEGFVLGDLDLLVCAGDLEHIRNLLLSLGYHLAEQDGIEGMIKEGFVSLDGLVAIDVHTDLFWTGCRVVYSACFSSNYRRNSVQGSIRGSPVRTLAHRDAIPYQILHDLVAHPHGLLWTTTARLYRLCRMLESKPDAVDWRETIGSAKTEALQNLMLAYVGYTCSELGVKVPAEWQLPENRREEVWLKATANAPRSIQAECHQLFVSGEKNGGGHALAFMGLLAGSWQLAARPGSGIFRLPRRWAVVTVSFLYVLIIRGVAALRFKLFPRHVT